MHLYRDQKDVSRIIWHIITDTHHTALQGKTYNTNSHTTRRMQIKRSIQHSLTQQDDRKTKKDAKTSIQHKKKLTYNRSNNKPTTTESMPTAEATIF